MTNYRQSWQEKTIKEVTKKTTQNKPADDEKLIYVDIGSIDRKSKKIASPQYLLGVDAPSRARKRIHTDDVLVSLTRPNLNAVAIVPEEYHGQYASTGFDVLKPDTIVPRFLYYLVRTQDFIDTISGKTQGALYPAAKSTDVQSYSFFMPSKSEQQCIADRLDSIFDKLEMAQSRLEKVPQLLKRFRMSVLSAAVSGELTEEWRDATPSLEAVLSNNFIQSYNGMSLDDLPQGWGWVHFKSAAKIESNLVDPKLTPNDIHLAPNHIEPNTGRILELVTVEQDKVKSNKHRFYPGQIIYSKIRPYLNKVCAVDFEGVCSADMYPVKAYINREYLLYVMLSDIFVYWTSQQQGRVVLPKINQKALNEIPVPVPPSEEQSEIARIVGELWAKADAVEKQYLVAKQRVDKLTQSILARAFRGELFEPFTDKVERVTQPQSLDVIDKKFTAREELTIERENKIQSTLKSVNDKSEFHENIRSSVAKSKIENNTNDTVIVDLDAEQLEVKDVFRNDYRAEVRKAQELLFDTTFSVEQFRSITEFNGSYDELKALIMNLLKGISGISEPLLEVEGWDEKSGDYLLRVVKKK